MNSRGKACINHYITHSIEGQGTGHMSPLGGRISCVMSSVSVEAGYASSFSPNTVLLSLTTPSTSSHIDIPNCILLSYAPPPIFIESNLPKTSVPLSFSKYPFQIPHPHLVSYSRRCQPAGVSHSKSKPITLPQLPGSLRTLSTSIYPPP
ncbi:hypothetical protein P691DRAFT_270564 [Macrolepiota fuliginosa MF-IS2]|uniref:Uncharacterized protein n=1 Tax=Macrolepiota fuliginosa MF-IS2 TaxID=1400762 RepID=A0A9P5X6H5_9AGAR|nr:hypothetical protein P691DRAFT_270564 [Macrolepiota fuliginosa MF-IS2]